jgi:formate dehydrogenase (NADP+) beta subunit
MAEPTYRVSVPDLSFYQASIPCQFACPVRTDARGYVTAIAQGEDERAYLIARETNPFASTCGYVCGAPCEAACRRGSARRDTKRTRCCSTDFNSLRFIAAKLCV